MAKRAALLSWAQLAELGARCTERSMAKDRVNGAATAQARCHGH
jgi:hypothetical protein